MSQPDQSTPRPVKPVKRRLDATTAARWILSPHASLAVGIVSGISLWAAYLLTVGYHSGLLEWGASEPPSTAPPSLPSLVWRTLFPLHEHVYSWLLLVTWLGLTTRRVDLFLTEATRLRKRIQAVWTSLKNKQPKAIVEVIFAGVLVILPFFRQAPSEVIIAIAAVVFLADAVLRGSKGPQPPHLLELLILIVFFGVLTFCSFRVAQLALRSSSEASWSSRYLASEASGFWFKDFPLLLVVGLASAVFNSAVYHGLFGQDRRVVRRTLVVLTILLAIAGLLIAFDFRYVSSWEFRERCESLLMDSATSVDRQCRTWRLMLRDMLYVRDILLLGVFVVVPSALYAVACAVAVRRTRGMKL